MINSPLLKNENFNRNTASIDESVLIAISKVSFILSEIVRLNQLKVLNKSKKANLTYSTLSASE